MLVLNDYFMITVVDPGHIFLVPGVGVPIK